MSVYLALPRLCCGRCYWAVAANLVQWPHRAGRWSPFAISRSPPRRWAINAALYKTIVFRRSARSTRASPAWLDARLPSALCRLRASGLPLSLAFLVGIVVGGLASLGGRAVRRFVHRVRAQSSPTSLPSSFGEGAKALPGAIYGAADHSGNGRDAGKAIAGLFRSLGGVVFERSRRLGIRSIEKGDVNVVAERIARGVAP